MRTATTKRLFLSVGVALLGGSFTPVAFSQTSCSNSYPPRYRVAYDDNTVATSVIGPPSISQALTEAAAAWNSNCDFANMPPLMFSPGLDRSPGDTNTNSILVSFSNGLGPELREGDETSHQLAQWVRGTNRVLLYNLPPSNPNDPPTGTPINWNDPRMLNTLIHEIGHALGLAHDNCQGGLMQEMGFIPPNAQIDRENCSKADRLQEPICGGVPGQEESPAKAVGAGYCPPGCDCPGGYPDPDDPLDRLNPCGSLGRLCDDSDEPELPWHRGFLSVTCTSILTNVMGGAYIEVTCREEFVRATEEEDPAAPGSAPSQPASLNGAGPAIRVTSFTDGARVQGLLPISGSVVAPVFGVDAMAAWVDDQPVTLSGLVLHLPSSASCAHPAGGTDPDCPAIGFSGALDTRQLSEGVRTLKVVAIDRRSPYPRFSLFTRRLLVDNVCDDTQAPATAITSPASGGTVSGAVAVAATASDNLGVISVQLLVDGAVVGTDTSAPYSWSWNSTSSSPGTHTLQSRAFDACNNNRTSAAVSVTVPAPVVPPDIAVYQDFDNVEVPIGGSSTITSTTPNVATSRRFRITNLGGEPLVLNNPSSLISAPCLALSELPTSPVPVGGVSYFRVRLLCGAAGTYSGTVSILSNDPNEANYSFTVVGTVTSSNPPPPTTAPDIAVYQAFDGIEVPRGGSSLINSTVVNVASSRRFRVANLGNASLTISNPGSLVSGTCLSLSETPVTPVPAGGEAYFRVRLYCGTPGTYTGTVTVLSNDPEEASYSFAVVGAVTAQ